MIDQHEIKVTAQGSGYVVGEMPTQHKDFTYLRERAQVCLFDGLDTMLNYVSTLKPVKGNASEDTDDPGFHAFDTYDEALSTFRSKPESVVKFDPAELRIKDESESGQTVDYDVVGDYVDMGRHMEGIPESWGSMHNGNARNRRVNIIINLNQTWNVDHNAITHRGERILRLVDALEAGGVRTQLVGVKSNQCGHAEVIIKRHEEVLTISDLAVVSHPEFLRRICFRINENSETWDWGYGSGVIFSEAIQSKPEMLHSDNNDEMNILVDSNFYDRETIDSHFDKLEKLLVWEMSKPVPEVDAVKVDATGLYFEPNGMRSEDEIRQEGLEAING